MNIKIPLKVKIHNRYDVFATNVKTGETKQIAQAENILLDNFWKYWLGGFTDASIRIGSGTGALDPARTELFTAIATLSTTAEAVDYSLFSDGIISRRRYATITEVQYVGQFIREIGLIRNYLQTHALLTDMNGNPVAIEKTDTDIITFYSTFYAYFDLDALKALGIRITPKYALYDFAMTGGPISIPANIGLSAVRFPANNTEASSFMIRNDSSGSWSAALKKITAAYERLPAATNNISEILSASLGSADTWFDFGLTFDLLNENNYDGSFIEGESVGVGDDLTKDFKTTYGMIRSGAIVYVNDVEQVSGVTVDVGKPNKTNLGLYMDIIESNNGRLAVHMQSATTVVANDYIIAENQFYASMGIVSVEVSQGNLYWSDDLTTWTQIANPAAIGAEYQNKRYWKFVATGTSGRCSNWITDADLNNIHFDTEVAQDAVVTIDYTTQICIKNSNYVIDSAVELIFDEYTEEY